MSETAVLGLQNINRTAHDETLIGICLLTDRGRVLFKGGGKEISFMRNSCKIRNHPKRPMTQVRHLDNDTQAEVMTTWNFADASVLPNNAKWTLELPSADPKSIQKIFFDFLQGSLCATPVEPQPESPKDKSLTEEVTDASLSRTMTFMKSKDILDKAVFVNVHQSSLYKSVKASKGRPNTEGCALRVPTSIMKSLKEWQEDTPSNESGKTNNRAAIKGDMEEDVMEFLEDLFKEFPQLKKHYETHVPKEMLKDEYISRLVHSPFFAVINKTTAPMSIWKTQDAFVKGLPSVFGDPTWGLKAKASNKAVQNLFNNNIPVTVRLEDDSRKPGHGVNNIKDHHSSYIRGPDVAIEEKNSNAHILESVFERLNRHSTSIMNDVTVTPDEAALIDMLKTTEEGAVDKFKIQDDKPKRLAEILTNSSAKLRDSMGDEALSSDQAIKYVKFPGMAVRYRGEENKLKKDGSLLLYRDYERPRSLTYEYVPNESLDLFHLITRIGSDEFKKLHPDKPLYIVEETGLYDKTKCHNLLSQMISQNLEGQVNFGRKIQQLGLSQMYRKANITAKHVDRSRELARALEKDGPSYDEALVLYLEEFANIQRRVANVLKVCWSLPKTSMTPTTVSKWTAALAILKEEVSDFQSTSQIIQYKPETRRLLNKKCLCNNLSESINKANNMINNKK